MPGGGHLKMNKGGRLYDYMKAGGKLPMVKNDDGETVPFYAADGKGKMEYGGKTMGHGGMNDGEPMLTIRIGEDGMKYMEKGDKVEATAEAGDREKGTIFYDKEARGFFEVKEGQQGTYAQKLTGGPGESQKVIDYLEEAGGKGSVGIPAHRELEEKYPGLAMGQGEYTIAGAESNLSGKTTQTFSGVKGAVADVVQEALSTGDPLLLSAVVNPYGGAANNAIEGVVAYGYERKDNVKGQERGIVFQPATVDGDGKMFQTGPSEKVTAQVFSKDSPVTGQTIITPEGETIQVNPDAMQTPGFGEGSSNPGPDAPPRTREEGAVPYQMNFGGRMRSANQGAKMARRTVFRFPRS